MDIYKTRFMLAALMQMLPVRTFLMDLFFTKLPPVLTETVDIDIIKGKRRLAPMQSPVIEGKVVEKLGFTTNSYKPAYVKPKMVDTAHQFLDRQAGETVYSAKSLQDRAGEALTEELATLDEMITRREEWMAAQALTTGKISITGEGVNYVVDFLMAATHIITLGVGDVWTNAASDPLEDLRTWRRLILKDSGLQANVVVMASDVYDVFIKNSAVTDALDLRRVDNGQIDPSILADGAIYIGYIKDIGCDIYVYDEWYVPDDGSAALPMFPQKKVLMGSTRARCYMHYAAIQDLKVPGGASLERYPKTWDKEDPSMRFVQVQSAPLAGLHQPDGFVIARVLT